MKKLFHIGATTCLFFFSPIPAATSPNTSDQVLIAYKLNSDAQTAFTSATSGPASFWDEWDTQNGSSLNRDYAEMTRTNNGSGTISSDNDAKMIVRMAWATEGVYLYCKITDDSWNAKDSVVLFFDADTRDEIHKPTEAAGYYPSPTDNYFTYNSSYYRFPLASLTPTGFTLGSGRMGESDGTVSSAADDHYGMTIRVHQSSATIRILEVFIPKGYILHDYAMYDPGFDFRNLTEGDEHAFTIQYKDNDGPNAGTLSLKKNKDPLANPRGNIALQEDITNAPWCAYELGELWDPNAVGIRPVSRTTAVPLTRAIPAAFWSLDGRRAGRFMVPGCRVGPGKKLLIHQ